MGENHPTKESCVRNMETWKQKNTTLPTTEDCISNSLTTVHWGDPAPQSDDSWAAKIRRQKWAGNSIRTHRKRTISHPIS